MKNTVDVLVLGDSAFSSLGGRFLNALDYFPLKRRYDRPVKFFNGAMTGMTSADAAAHAGELVAGDDYDALIVYIGNCDPCGFGYIKSRHRVLNFGIAARIENLLYRKRNPLSRRNGPYQFREGLLPSKGIREAVSPEDYASFLSTIIKQCGDSKIPLILVNPISNPDFPPCGHLGNSMFYRIFNINDDRVFDVSGPAAALAAAVNLQKAGNEAEAMKAYSGIISGSPGKEQAFIAKNNLASICFDRGDQGMAVEMLREIPSDGNPLYPVILFNLAVAHASMGEEGIAEEAFTKACESDRGTYRITGRYRRAISEIIREDAAGVIEINLADCLSGDDLIDYCHPDEAGHRKIFDAVSKELEGLFMLCDGEYRPEIECIPLNPDIYAGFQSNFFDHFGISGEFSSDVTAVLLEEARESEYEEIIKRDVLKKPGPQGGHMLYLLRHPLFGDPGFLKISPPLAPADLGRFPETFGIRHMMEIYRDPPVNRLFSEEFGNVRYLILLYEKIERWWNLLPGRGPVISRDRIRELTKRLDRKRILRRSLSLLDHILESEPSAFNRYRTISYWFFRESLIFGSTSHWTIFTERTAMRDLVDTALFMLLGEGDDLDAGNEFYSILAKIEEILDIHREFLSPVAGRLYGVDREWLDAYKSRFEGLQRLSL